MRNTIGTQVREKAIELLRVAPDGIHYADLHHSLQPFFPELKSIRSIVWDLNVSHPQQVGKPGNGLFVYIGGKPAAAARGVKPLPAVKGPVVAAAAKAPAERKKKIFIARRPSAKDSNFDYTKLSDDAGVVVPGDQDIQDELRQLPGFRESKRGSDDV